MFDRRSLQGAVDAGFNYAVSSYEAGDWVTTMNILRFLSILAPTDAGIWRALARCHEDLGEEGIAEYLRRVGCLVEVAS